MTTSGHPRPLTDAERERVGVHMAEFARGPDDCINAPDVEAALEALVRELGDAQEQARLAVIDAANTEAERNDLEARLAEMQARAELAEKVCARYGWRRVEVDDGTATLAIPADKAFDELRARALADAPQGSDA